MRGTFLSASYPACGDDRMYDLHHGLLVREESPRLCRGGSRRLTFGGVCPP